MSTKTKFDRWLSRDLRSGCSYCSLAWSLSEPGFDQTPEMHLPVRTNKSSLWLHKIKFCSQAASREMCSLSGFYSDYRKFTKGGSAVCVCDHKEASGTQMLLFKQKPTNTLVFRPKTFKWWFYFEKPPV